MSLKIYPFILNVTLVRLGSLNDAETLLKFRDSVKVVTEKVTENSESGKKGKRRAVYGQIASRDGYVGLTKDIWKVF